MKPHGWIILDKPSGLGSTQAVSAVKRNLRAAGMLRKFRDGPKVGHGGTLDPLATGVLPIAIGEATKLCGRMLDASKIYDFTIRFGTQTDTLDAEGQAVAVSDHRPSRAEIAAVLAQFTGPITQVPPAFSALKIDGQRAYNRARSGEVVAMAARAVEIFALSMCCSNGDARDIMQAITLTANVSKGTYIRSLARDIALALGTVGHVTMLRRTRAGPFSLDSAISLDKLNEIAKGAPLEDFLLPLEAGLVDIPALTLSSDQADRLRVGQMLAASEIVGSTASDDIMLAKADGGTPLALVQHRDGFIRVVRGFNLSS